MTKPQRWSDGQFKATVVVDARTPEEHRDWEHQQYLRREFLGIEREVDTLFFKGHDTVEERLKLLWGFIKADQIDFKKFVRLDHLIHLGLPAPHFGPVSPKLGTR